MYAVEAAGYLINAANVTHVKPVGQTTDFGPNKWVLAIGLTGGTKLLELPFDSETEANDIRTHLFAAINTK